VIKEQISEDDDRLSFPMERTEFYRIRNWSPCVTRMTKTMLRDGRLRKSSVIVGRKKKPEREG